MKTDIAAILSSLDELAKRAGISRSRALAAWYAINFYDLDEDDALEAAEVDGGNDQGIDIVFADSASQKIVVIQAHCPENIEKNCPKNKFDAAVASLPYLKNPENLRNSGRSDLAEIVEDLIKTYPEYGFRIGLITLGLNNESIESAVSAQNAMHSNEELEYFFLSQHDLESSYTALIDAEGGVTEDDFSFDSDHYKDKGEFGSAWIGTVNSDELLRLYEKYENRLFAGNVRLYLGDRKGGINEQIIKTAKEKAGQFWALNNGITIVADSVEQTANSKTLKLKRFSIVNGCQTTSCLYQSGKTKAKVLARIIAASAGVKNEIIRYNNSQNAVKIWAVRATDNIQEQLRNEFKEHNIKYAPKQEGTRQKRSLKIIELDKVSQYLAASQSQYLIQAINNKAELFDTPYKKLFPNEIKAKTVYLAWLIGSIAEAKRQERLKSLKRDSPSDKNVGLLGIAGAFWIVYCTYKLISKFSNINSPQITLGKMQAKEFENALTKYVVFALDMFYESAVDGYDEEEYGTFKSTLRSNKFLDKLDSKINNKIVRMREKSKPALSALDATAKSINV
jgi:hypothetical protein